MSSRWRRIRLLFLIGLLVLLVARIGLGWWADRRLQAEYARLEQKYGNLDGRSILAPQVPATENRVRLVKAALALLAPGRYENGISALRASITQFQKASDVPRVPDDLRQFVEGNRESLALLAEARSKQKSSWDVDYSGNYDGPSLLDVRMLSDVAYLAALIDLDSGAIDDAAATVASGLSLGASMRQEPALIVQLIRIAVTVQQCAAVEQLITRSEPSKETLEDLSRSLAESRELDPLSIGLLAELKFGNNGFAGMERGRPDLTSANRDFWAVWLGPVARLGRPFVTMARVHYLKEMDRLLTIQTGPRPRPSKAPAYSGWNWSHRLGAIAVPGLERSMESGDLFNSVLGATELGVALRRHRLDHEAYPDTLPQLVPSYLPRLPIDPFTGQPPIYARSGAGFTLKAQGGNNYVPRTSALEWAVPK